jgi:hypothetical protein
LPLPPSLRQPLLLPLPLLHCQCAATVSIAVATLITVGILPDGHLHTNPLPQIPTKQNVPTSKECLPGYFGILMVIYTLRSRIRPALDKVRTPWFCCLLDYHIFVTGNKNKLWETH